MPKLSLSLNRHDLSIFVAALVLLIAALSWIVLDSDVVSTEDAYVQGNVVQVTSQVGGTVIGIEADTTDHVESGRVLVRLNPVDAQIRYKRAEAALARATRQARTQYLQVQQLDAELDQRRNDLAKARADLARRQQLVGIGAVSKEEIRHAEVIAQNARSALVVSQQVLAQRRALVDGTHLESHPEVLAAAADLRDAYIALLRTTIAAPVTGTVTQRGVQAGQHISPGLALMSVVPLDSLWVNANFKESQLEHLRIGQPVILTSEVYGTNVEYHGSVAGLDAGTGSAFSLLPAQNATGNWIKVTQRVPVRITLQGAELLRQPLRIGMTMHAKVDTRDHRGTQVSSAIALDDSYQTHVFDQEMREADRRVAQVIHANTTTQAALAGR
ncbi:efflux RND transporter periplasmic adaptor subunit [Pseudomonas sp. P66]|uniref:Efflux RND transporter periplasmic adaptor subunit n=1 Tax=Pseudomonas arcuscaelestis TaxID=2710591 RepID=A0ABS2BU04_9PSED|nr:efflux RND transporter periplasmic adaptor subunit [Pseudomonas arcuscaelestis]MBM3112338.1 efflux RND transporter periplasmic adaptor subunit [Pseudomonas arcuscaelestis]MBM5456456.1 efflux RND transporter periplasmic adaptor subunit [Pseudomonas arcuscaelestis]